jgi:hypothetical protein
MKVFISWSGNDSKQVAQQLKDWIPDVLQGVETWISSDDIAKGALWMSDIGDKLNEIGVGILCLTRSNIDAPWILFEAGALSKGLTKNRVCPLLIDLSQKELKPPLASFNATMPTQEDMLRLIKTINVQMGEKRLPEERVEKAFDMWWGGFDKNFAAIVKGFKPTKAVVQPTVQEMVAEILELARSIQANVQQPMAFQPAPAPSGWMGLVNPSAHLAEFNPGSFFTLRTPAQQLRDAIEAMMKKNPQVQPYVPLPIQTDTSSSD